MKELIFFSIILCFCNCFSQEWKSIDKASTYKITPYEQFSVNPYSNELWFVQYNKTTTIQNNGVVAEYGEMELGNLGGGLKINFTFIENEIYFCKDYEGLYKLNGSTSELIFPISNIFNVLKNNKDTIYITIPFETYIKFINSQNLNTNQYGDNIFSKKSFFYKSGYIDGNLVKITGPNPNDFVDYFATDAQYLCYFFNDAKFSRLTDTFYVACKQGISYAYNYDFLDTITPNNTTNMPSANVLEMEFDQLDRLWAVFGDTNDHPFSIAMFEDDTWINYYDVNNSPIYFDAPLDNNYFLQMEIDTLGNIWICDKNNLHTLLSPTTPDWVGLKESKLLSFEVYPNPAENKVNIHFLDNSYKKILLTDLNGSVLQEIDVRAKDVQLSLVGISSGIYFISVEEEENHVSYQKIFKN